MSVFHVEDYLRQLSNAANIDDCPKVPIPSIQKNQNYLFISYCHRDYQKVYSDLAHLYHRGVRFWYDKGLSAGKDWEKEAEEHIRNPRCCGVIFYLSTNMFLSNSVLKEIEFTRMRKRSNQITKKNYFCVNLQDGNISDMLFEAQRMKQSKGLPLLDTDALNILTSTFSDKATYIRYNSIFHVDELIDQIQRQFDVTTRPEEHTAEQSALGSIPDSRSALRAFFGKETALVPLCRYLREAYRNDKKAVPWMLIPWGMVMGLLLPVVFLHMVMSMQDVPFLAYLAAHYSREYLMLLTAFCSCILSPYLILKLFWLYYLTPVYRKCERSTVNRIIHFLLFFTLSVMICGLSVLWCLTMMVLIDLLIRSCGTMMDLFP